MLRRAAVLCAVLPAVAGGADLVPFVIPAGPDARSAVALPPGEPIGPDSPRIVARAGRFERAGRRVRIWGVNTCFGANFPAHADAERLAARLAAAGINSVRLHHMDMQAFPRGIWDPADPKRLSAEALDRLDYLIDRLARRGITVNVNLHVSRTHSRVLGLPRQGRMPNFDKVIGIFTPALVAAQKRYARDLLSHVSAYRKVRYADDPAVAFVEITNEDSFFMWSGEQTLRDLGPYYRDILRGLWIDWLKRRYGTTAAVRAAWGRGAEPLGANLIGDPDFTLRPPADPARARWALETHGQARASLGPAKSTPGAARVEIARTGSANWHIQLKYEHIRFAGGQYYTLRFRARADRPRRLALSAGMAHAPWRILGLSRSAALTRQWKTFRIGFVCRADEPDGRISFVLGDDTAAVEIADVHLGTGGQVGLAEGESLEAGNIPLFADGETDARANDRFRFLAETEKNYFDSMRAFLRDQLGCRALVTGTIVFGPAGLYAQSDMDYIDSHAYWHHPRFPGRPWDPANWLVEQTAMTDAADGGTLADLAARRLAGKPYTVSEYNHPAPMDAQAECVPLIAAFAAAQGWDGVWLFAYCHRTDDWNPRHFTSFFDMDANPAKFGFFAPAAVLFRDGGLGPLAPVAVADFSGPDPAGRLAELHRRYGRSMRGVLAGEAKLAWPVPLTRRVYASLGAAPPPAGKAPGQVTWTVRSGRGRFLARGRTALAQAGWWPDGQGRNVFRAAMAASLDAAALPESGKVFIAVCGRCENTGMKFSADRRTVGRNWGTAPVRIEPVDHVLELGGAAAGQVRRLQPLGPDGLPRGEAMRVTLGPGGTVTLPARCPTMWYLLTR